MYILKMNCHKNNFFCNVGVNKAEFFQRTVYITTPYICWTRVYEISVVRNVGITSNIETSSVTSYSSTTEYKNKSSRWIYYVKLVILLKKLLQYKLIDTLWRFNIYVHEYRFPFYTGFLCRFSLLLQLLSGQTGFLGTCTGHIIV